MVYVETLYVYADGLHQTCLSATDYVLCVWSDALTDLHTNATANAKLL